MYGRTYLYGQYVYGQYGQKRLQCFQEVWGEVPTDVNGTFAIALMEAVIPPCYTLAGSGFPLYKSFPGLQKESLDIRALLGNFAHQLELFV